MSQVIERRSELEEIRELHAIALESGLTALQISEREFAIHVDHVLGPDFPKAKRDVMLCVQRNMRRRMAEVVDQALRDQCTSEEVAETIYVVQCEPYRHFAQILSREEYVQFCGMQPGEMPPRLIDPSAIHWLPEVRDVQI